MRVHIRRVLLHFVTLGIFKVGPHYDTLENVMRDPVLFIQYAVDEPHHCLFDEAQAPVILQSVKKWRSPDGRGILFREPYAHMVSKLVNLIRIRLAQLSEVIVAILILHQYGSILQNQLHEFVVNFEAFLNSGIVQVRKGLVEHFDCRFTLSSIYSDV